jgi:hypothetical protein
MAFSEVPRFVAVQSVRSDRAADFEAFVIGELAPAVKQAKPQLASQWKAVRASQAGSESEDTVYLALFYGDADLDEWDLRNLRTDAEGAAEAAELDDTFGGFLTSPQVVYSIDAELPVT